MVDGGLIEIEDAANIAHQRGMAYVIVFGVQNDGGKFHVATYGTTKARCKLAAVMGDRISKAVIDGEVMTPQEEPYKGYDELLVACRTVRSSLLRGITTDGLAEMLAKAIRSTGSEP